MSFQSQLAADVDAVFLNTAEFGETAHYEPVGEKTRSVTVVIDRSHRDRQDMAHHQIDVDTITVQASRSALTGLPNPQTGDRLWLAEDSPAEPWVYQAERHRDAQFVVCTFVRKRLRRSGRLKPEAL